MDRERLGARRGETSGPASDGSRYTKRKRAYPFFRDTPSELYYNRFRRANLLIEHFEFLDAEDGVIAELFLDAEELIVFCNTV